MRLILAILVLTGAAVAPAWADHVPLPRPRPPVVVSTEPRSFEEAVAGLDLDTSKISSELTECDHRLATMAVVAPLPRLIGPGACGGEEMVELTAVLLPDKRRIPLVPAPRVQCPMAESLAAWVRDEVAPHAARLGTTLKSIENYNSYECRGRNRVKGAKLSEHGKGNAIDLRAIHLTDGRRIELTDEKADKPLRTALRETACQRFTTVLGPGDPYHSEHIHLDNIARRGGYRLCQWDVREPAPLVASAESRGRAAASAVPLPPPAGDSASNGRPMMAKGAQVSAGRLPAPGLAAAGRPAVEKASMQVSENAVPLPTPKPRPAKPRQRRKSGPSFHLPFTLWR